MIINKEFYADLIKKIDVPIFYQYWYLEFCYENDWSSIFVKHKNGSFAVLPFKKNSLGDVSFIGMPKMTQYAGAFLKIVDGLSKKKQYETYDYLIRQILNDIDKLNIDYYGQRFHLNYCDWTPFVRNKYKYSQRITYVLNSSENSFENIFSDYSTQVRNKIKNKYKIEVNSIYSFENFEQYYTLIEHSLSKYNKAPKYSKYDLAEFIRESLSNNSCLILDAKLNNELLAVSIFLYDNEFVYYYLAGENKNFKEYNAPTILLNKAIMYACNKNLNFDFCGSMIDSLSNFYESFGADRKSVLVIEKDGDNVFDERSKIDIKSSF